MRILSQNSTFFHAPVYTIPSAAFQSILSTLLHCGKEIAVKQLAQSSWKHDLTEGNFNSFIKACNKCPSILRQTKQHHIANLKAMHSNHCFPQVMMATCQVRLWCVLPLHPVLTANGHTADFSRDKAEYLKSASKSCVANTFHSVPT